MQIGPYTLDNNVALAPMAGVTDLPFRQLCRRLGAGYVVGEMVASDPLLRNTAKTRLRGVHHEEPLPRAIQIVGWDPKAMAEAARFNRDQGASIIDINMSCPAKKVCKRYAGSALLGDETAVSAILKAVVAAVDIPVTLKIRTGLSPDYRNGVRIARIAEGHGVAALAVHGRTRQCKYFGKAEFDTIRQICRSVTIPVFANGDITDYDTALKVLKYTGADGVMIGRGAHGAPWFPGNLGAFLTTGRRPGEPGRAEQHQIIMAHLESLYDFYGVYQGVRIARKHIKWYSEKRAGSVDFRKRFNQANDPATQLSLVTDYFRSHH